MIGRMVRRMLGPLELPVTRLYRRVFFDCRSLARSIRNWTDAEGTAAEGPPVRRILEVGCGEGQLTAWLAREFPRASITGIDVIEQVGRLFRGDRRRVDFRRQTVHDFAAAHPAEFDLVVICDVLHHVPWQMHAALLADSHRVLRPGGTLVLKDWERRSNLICLLGYLSDRYITGDRIRYGTADGFRRLIEAVLGPGCVVDQQRFPPWVNNLAFFCRAAGTGSESGSEMEGRARPPVAAL